MLDPAEAQQVGFEPGPRGVETRSSLNARFGWQRHGFSSSFGAAAGRAVRCQLEGSCVRSTRDPFGREPGQALAVGIV